MYINKVGFEYYDIGRFSYICFILIILLIISYLQLKLGDSLMTKVWTIVILSICICFVDPIYWSIATAFKPLMKL